MIELNNLKEIRKMYEKGVNLIEYFKKQGYEGDALTEAVMVSYDIQAGTYTESDKNKPEVRDKYTDALANVVNQLGNFASILEAGVGEATTLTKLLPKLNQSDYAAYGFDISWSRIKYAQSNCHRRSLGQVQLFTGDIFSVPIQNDSIDIVYTLHSLEPNGGREKAALEELYRITGNYLVLLEPIYEWASEEGKARMDKMGYIKNVEVTIRDLGYDMIECRPLEYAVNPLNPTGLIVIKKEEGANQKNKNPLACPITKHPVTKRQDCLFSPESLLAYPIIGDIPCLLPQNAVVATHFADTL
ncbi:methyltransferase domain-containing protein [Tunicatimonas pelagia]|uniref:methyltransferase domain-containing protein n=1 Tax=Tunicatimonas pelagia TaxID=931531 RepID=UPI002666F4E5|nr:methyltransferase domain-containing protein [Tunicatimonas pelagia]WKN43245.1 methyltransferase domain-containing protein [Tunicatimonas pelagia]